MDISDSYKYCKESDITSSRVDVGIVSQLGIVALFLEMDYLRMLKIAPDIKYVM